MGADQLCSHRTADLCLCFAYAKILFSHEAALLIQLLENVYLFATYSIVLDCIKQKQRLSVLFLGMT